MCNDSVENILAMRNIIIYELRNTPVESFQTLDRNAIDLSNAVTL